MRLFTYVVRHDAGAAPNPYGKVCTLAICKPAIRRVAEEGDWVVGFASTESGIDIANQKIIYAMRISEVKTMAEYDGYCRQNLPIKIPKEKPKTYSEHVGDCIYFQKGDELIQRPGVHSSDDIQRDIGGKNVLLSNTFFYFGRNAKGLPGELLDICVKGRGHRSTKNEPFKELFVRWVTSLPYKKNELLGDPLALPDDWKAAVKPGSCSGRHDYDEEEEE